MFPYNKEVKDLIDLDIVFTNPKTGRKKKGVIVGIFKTFASVVDRREVTHYVKWEAIERDE